MSAIISPSAHTPTDSTISRPRITAGPPAAAVAPRRTAATRYALFDRSWSTTADSVIDAAPAFAERANWEQWAEHARAAFERAASEQRPTITAAARLRVGRLAAIQAALGLSMQDLAAVLRLSRPQLYRWFNAADDVRIQEARRQRLAAVERIARAWQVRSAAPLQSAAHEPLANGSTVFVLLTADTIDEAAVHTAFDELATRLDSQPRTLSQRLADAGFKRRPSTRSLPSDE